MTNFKHMSSLQYFISFHDMTLHGFVQRKADCGRKIVVYVGIMNITKRMYKYPMECYCGA